MTDVWGPWQDHDGKGYPKDAIGKLCQVVDISVRGMSDPSEPFVCGGDCPDGGSWNWDNQKTTDIFAYRVAKPKGMIVLEEILEIIEGKSASDLVVMLVELRQTQREGTGR